MPAETSAQSRPHREGAWGLPILSVTIGIAYLVGGLVGGDTWFGVFGLCLMTGLALVLLLVRRRSETVQGLLDRGDERINAMDLKATAFTGAVLAFVVIGAFVVDIARGGDGDPYAWLGAVGGGAYVAAFIYQRLRG